MGAARDQECAQSRGRGGNNYKGNNRERGGGFAIARGSIHSSRVGNGRGDETHQQETTTSVPYLHCTPSVGFLDFLETIVLMCYTRLVKRREEREVRDLWRSQQEGENIGANLVKRGRRNRNRNRNGRGRGRGRGVTIEAEEVAKEIGRVVKMISLLVLLDE